MAFVQSAAGEIQGSASAITIGLNGVSSSNALILLLGTSFAPSATPTGFTVSNVPTLYVSSGLHVGANIWHNTSPSQGTNNVTINFSGTVFCSAVLVEWSGMVASPLDAAPAASNSTIVSTAGANSVASSVLAQANEAIFAVIFANTTGTGTSNVGCTTPPGFTQLYVENDTLATDMAQFSYALVSSTASVTANWAWTDTANIVTQAAMASFKLNSSNILMGGMCL